MTLEICTEWSKIEYIECTCPHCHVIDTYFPAGKIGDVVRCVHCLKQFKLGEQK